MDMPATTFGGEAREETERGAGSPRGALAFLIAFSIFAAGFNLGGRTIDNKDYLRYAEVGREILESGDWIMLRQNGRIYVDKPPLHFWKIAGSYLIAGVGPFGARLPAAIFGVGGVLLAYAFAHKILRNAEVAFLGGMALISAYGYFWWARRTRIDMEFGVLYSLALILFFCGVEAQRSRRKAIFYLGFWLALGLAFLDKGPVALTALAVALPWGIARSRAGRLAPQTLAAASICFFAAVLLWLSQLAGHPEFREFWEIYKEKPIMARSEGLFYYAPELAMKLFPATPFLLLGVWGYARHRAKVAERQGLGFLFLWIAIFLFLLHLTPVKNHRYLLPAFIPCAIAAALGFNCFRARYPEIFDRLLWWCDLAFLLLAAGSAASPLILPWILKVKTPPLTAIAYAAALGAALGLTRAFLPFKRAGLFASFVFLLQAIEIGDTLRNRKTSPLLSVSERIAAQGLSPSEIACHRCPDRAREGLSFYLNSCLRTEDVWASVAGDPAVRGIVTEGSTLATELAGKGSQAGWTVVELGEEGLVLLLRGPGPLGDPLDPQ